MTDQAAPEGHSLSSRPSMEYLRKCAKEKLRELRTHEPDTKLAAAQRAIARDHGFQSWRNLKAHVDAVTVGRLKPVFDAIDRGDVQALRPILEQEPDLVSALFVPHESTLLHRAIRHRQFEIARLLLEQGANPDQRDRGDNAAPIHFAAEMGDLEAVRFLVDAGADIHGGGDTHGLGVLGWATCFGRCQKDVASYLLSKGAKHHVFSAIALGDRSALEAVIAQDPSSLTRTMSKWEDHQTPLHFAVNKNKPALLAKLLDAGADALRTDRMERTALQVAAARRNEEALDAFARFGYSPEDLETDVRTGFQGVTPILNVKNVPNSIAYYVDALGFNKDWDWGSPPSFAAVSRGDTRIFLCQDGQGHPGTWMSIWVEDMDALHQEYLDSGARIVQAPANFPWGVREMNVSDPDGHRLRMSSNPTDDGAAKISSE